MSDRRKPKPLTGAVRMQASGKKAILVWLSAEDHATFSEIAASRRMPLTQLVVSSLFAMAEKLGKNPIKKSKNT